MNIKVLIMDVDGTLTDGKLYMSDQGELFKAFDVKDGYAIKHLLPEYNIIPIIITGRESQILNKRMKELGINEVHQAIQEKPQVLKKVIDKYRIIYDEVAYIGDDLNDLPCMKLCGLKGCPKDAVNGIKEIANFISLKDGGNGAVREFIEYIISFNNSTYL